MDSVFQMIQSESVKLNPPQMSEQFVSRIKAE